MARAMGTVLGVAGLCLALAACATPEPDRHATPTPGAATPSASATAASPASGSAVRIRMSTARSAHTATALADGRVLVAGGFANGEEGLASAELFDPTTLTFSPAGPLRAARQSHTATLLADGRVLLVGGLDRGRYLRTSELFDPVAGQFVPAGDLHAGRAGHAAVRMADGRVLLVGGVGDGWTFLSSAEIFDPATGTFTPTGSMATARESHTATLLADGRVLVVAGHGGARRSLTILGSAEVFDPAAGTFSPAGDLNVARHKHDAVALRDGRILVMGGADARDDQGQLRSAEMFDPQTGAFATVADLQWSRYKFQGTSQVLADGRVLVTGGAASTEWFEPASGVFRAAGIELDSARLFAAAATLSDGRVLLAGGYSQGSSGPAAAAQAILIRP